MNSYPKFCWAQFLSQNLWNRFFCCICCWNTHWRFFVVSASTKNSATCSYHFLILLTFWSLTSSFPGSPRDLIKPCLHLDANSPKFSAASELKNSFSEDLQNTICWWSFRARRWVNRNNQGPFRVMPLIMPFFWEIMSYFENYSWYFGMTLEYATLKHGNGNVVNHTIHLFGNKEPCMRQDMIRALYEIRYETR